MDENKKIKIIGLEGCPPCEKVKKILKKAGKDKEIEIIDLNSEKGQELLQKGVIPMDEKERVQVPFVLDENNQFCELFFDEDVVLAVCGEEIKVLYDREEEEKKQKRSNLENGK